MITVDLLTTIAECDALTAEFSKKREDALYKKEGVRRSKERLLNRKTKRDAEIASTIAQMASLDTVLGSIPDGDIKDEFLYDKEILKYKLYKLQNSGQISVDSYFGKEAEELNLQNAIDNYNSIMAQIDTHKASL